MQKQRAGSYNFDMRHQFHFLCHFFLKPIRVCLGCKGDRIGQFFKSSNVLFKLFHCYFNAFTIMLLLEGREVLLSATGNSSTKFCFVWNCSLFFFLKASAGRRFGSRSKAHFWICVKWDHLGSLLIGWNWLQKWVTFDQDRFMTSKPQRDGGHRDN